MFYCHSISSETTFVKAEEMSFILTICFVLCKSFVVIAACKTAFCFSFNGLFEV